MTLNPDTPSPEGAPSPTPKAYARPALTELGTVEVLTAGPQGGSIDQIVGSSGGFQPDGTS